MADNFDNVDEGEAALTGAASGALAGAAAGPVGAVAGAAIGAGIGIFQASSQNRAAKEAQRKRDEALYRASLLKTQAKKQTQSLQSTSKNLGPSKSQSTPNAIPTGSTPTAAIGAGVSSSGTF